MWFDIIVLEPFTAFCVTVICDIILTSNPKSKNKKINKNENK